MQERKRRDHIKDSFTGLKDAIPSLQARQGDKCSRAQILKKVQIRIYISVVFLVAVYITMSIRPVNTLPS